MKTFNVPAFYRSPLIQKVKDFRKQQDPKRRDFSPSVLDFGKIKYYIPRHFGFCYGVENAIEIAFRAIDENPDKRIFLLSQMIHNPEVNKDLQERGIQFLQDTYGNTLIDFSELRDNDVIIIPAFGSPMEILERIKQLQLQTYFYDTTCPFVERVWKKAEQIGKQNYTIIIHGKYKHEETRATFSRSKQFNHSVIIRDLEEAKLLEPFILEQKSQQEFELAFKEKFSEGFNIHQHFQRIGVINQTTMLATETEEISHYLKEVMIKKYGSENIKDHFADTHDTLCYATNENQTSVLHLLNTDADLAIVVGGYNSSNTSHLVELLQTKFPTYFISSANEIISADKIRHFNLETKEIVETINFLPDKEEVKIIITGGASCPDALLEQVIQRINGLLNIKFENSINVLI
ncbi:MAG: 4-hydroxy-3-methylbut-2-enyl diphosphate reductase [Bacteroidia bacterium]|nr:MAG: 4-hydroxy-3-methylbut-2-enyl diphosphate reductase [Bacteroidia bacterium]